MDDMHDQHETPTSDAASGVGHYLTGALAAADLAIRVRTWFTNRLTEDPAAEALRPGDLEQAGEMLDPKREAYRAMLDRDQGRDADSRTALLAWVTAQPHRDDNAEAELVAGRAEGRLRELHPDAMSRYDQLRAGLSPVEAMREVVPLIVIDQQHTTARELFTPMLDPAVALRANSSQALTAWSAALPIADTLPDAAVAAAVAEDRLRTLHPNAMSRYDTLRNTHTLTAALEEVGPLIDPAVSIGSASHAVQPAEERYAPVVREVLQTEVADQVLREQAWPALAGALSKAEELGADPAAVLAAAAGERELGSAKSVADVLAFRVEQHHVPIQPSAEPVPARSPTAADLVASSYPAPLTAARPGSGEQDLVVLGAALELGREADTERRTAQVSAGTSDDVATPHVDERREGLHHAQPHVARAGADQATATALLSEADTGRRATASADGAPAVAAQSYPTPVKAVSAAQAAPKAAAATPATRTVARQTPVAGRRR